MRYLNTFRSIGNKTMPFKATEGLYENVNKHDIIKLHVVECVLYTIIRHIVSARINIIMRNGDMEYIYIIYFV